MSEHAVTTMNVTLEATIAEREMRSDCLRVPFAARWNGQPVMVRAVLERTAVVYPADTTGGPDDRMLALRTALIVNPEDLQWIEPCPDRGKPRMGIYRRPSQRLPRSVKREAAA
jgi:hypothetical protein